MPLVEKNYRTQPYRIIAGHSLSGMFAIYSFLARPEMFNAYIAASPALYYDKDLLIKRAEETFKQDKNWNKVMYLGVGDEPIYTPSFNQFKNVLDKAKPKNFVYEFKEYKTENHASGVLPIFTAGLRKIFEGWEYPQNPSLAVQEEHFKKLTKKYGYEIKIPENLANEIGYELMQQKKLPEAIEAFKKGIELYPNSANIYDSLGEAYERSGSNKEAKENYEKALKLAEVQGDAEHLKDIKANLERVSAKMK
jgi:tetratricopeptide (TPR) repeat protein